MFAVFGIPWPAAGSAYASAVCILSFSYSRRGRDAYVNKKSGKTNLCKTIFK